LSFLTRAQTANAGVASTEMRVQLRDGYGNPAIEPADLALRLATTSATGPSRPPRSPLGSR